MNDDKPKENDCSRILKKDKFAFNDWSNFYENMIEKASKRLEIKSYEAPIIFQSENITSSLISIIEFEKPFHTDKLNEERQDS